MRKSDLLLFEQQLLNDLIQWPNEITGCSLILKPDDFHYDMNQGIYKILLSMSVDGTPIDLTMVHGKINSVAGQDYLMEITKLPSSTGANVEAHASMIHSYGRRRRLHQKLSASVVLAENPEKKIEDAISMAESAIFESVDTSEKTLTPASDFIVESLRAIEKRNEGMITGLKTGLQAIDTHMSGLQAQDLIVVGGRPAMGKTAICGQIAAYSALREGKKVAFFECEMSGRAVIDRILFSLAGVNGQAMRNGNITKEQIQKLTEVAPLFKDSGLFLDDSSRVSPMELKAKCVRMRSRVGLDLIVVDNIQKMKSDGDYRGNKRLEVAEVSRALKEIAKDLNVPVVAISHIKRLDSGRNDEPTLADLQESGNIEQDADIVLILYRKDEYEQVPSDEIGLTKLIYAKYREGQTGVKHLHFNRDLVTFSDSVRHGVPTKISETTGTRRGGWEEN
jgi:replicative DNA helicase